MFTIGKQELQVTLRQLDQAIYNHEQWVKDVTRTIVCRLPFDQRDVVEDAYRQCRFGQWYYGSPPQPLHDHPAFVAIGSVHAEMHQRGAQLLLATTIEGSDSTRTYDSFVNAVDRLHLEVYSLKHELEELLINRDSLTGAENRIGMLTKLRELHQLVDRGVQECSIAIMDLDHFKTVNDTYGHPVGDKVLVAWVNYIKQHMRPYDRIYRYGGEEFLLCLTNTSLAAANDVIERIRHGFTEVAINDDGTKTIRVTASFGITVLSPDVSVEQSIHRADTALYAAKNAGRDCVRIWDAAMTPLQDDESSP